MDELPHRLPQAGPSREEGEQQEMETSASATATASGLQSPPQRQSIQDKNNDDTLVQAAGDILYYVDAAGNPIDPDDMGDYALQQEGQQEQEGPTVDSSLLMEVDNEHLVELNEESRVPDHANGKALLQEQDETKTIPAGEEHEQEMDNNEIDKPDLQRYARPFIPPPKIDGVNQDSNQEALPPDYTVRYTITGHRKNVSCIRFSPNGEWLLTAGGDGRVLLYSIPNTKSNKTKTPIFIRSYIIPNPPPVKIKLNQNINSVPPVGSSGINDLCFMSNSNYFAVASDDKIIRIWKIDPFPREEEEEVLDESLKSLYNHNRVSSDNPTASINLESNQNQQQQQYTNGQEENMILPSSTLSKSTEKPIELKGHNSFIFCLAFTPQNNLLASGSFDETIKIWDLKRCTCLKTLPAHSDPVAALNFSGDGSILCSAGHDGLLRLWDTATGQCLKSLVDESNPPASHALFTPNSRYILVSSLDSTIRLWDYHAAVCIKTYTGHKNVKYSIPAMFVQPPKGKHGPTYILTGSEDGKIVFYDLQSRNIAFTLPGHKEAPILCIAHDPHSGMLATCALERGVKEYTVKIWVDRSRNRNADSAKRTNGRSAGGRA